MTQTTFLDGGDLLAPAARARASDPETSHAAARKVNVARCRMIVLQALTELGTATSDDLVCHCAGDVSPSGVRTRLKELQRDGVVRVCGERVNERGNRVRVYEVRK